MSMGHLQGYAHGKDGCVLESNRSSHRPPDPEKTTGAGRKIPTPAVWGVCCPCKTEAALAGWRVIRLGPGEITFDTVGRIMRLLDAPR